MDAMSTSAGFHACVACIVVSAFGCDTVFGLDSVTKPVSPDAAPDALGAGRWSVVVAGQVHTCALDTAGALYCWGLGGNGQLGLGEDVTSAATPTRIGMAMWTQISAQDRSTCGVQTNGSLWCWGANGTGQLGDGSFTDRRSPVQVDPATSWRTVAAGSSHSCAITSTGVARCWGDGYNGELGTGQFNVRSSTPVAVNSSLLWTAISVGQSHSCAIASTGEVWCWGDGYYGQVGNGSWNSAAAPERVSSQQFTTLASGRDHTCAVTTANHLRCWGYNDSGQVGDTGAGSVANPVSVGDDAGDWMMVGAGAKHTCAGKLDGSLWCWGANESGQRGDALINRFGPTPVELVGGSPPWTSVSGGTRHTCAIGADHNLWCFGLGPNGPDRTIDQPTQLPGNWKVVDGGDDHTCALDTAGALWCWGRNDMGQLGDTTRISRASPVMVDPGPWSQLSLGGDTACALRMTGELACWGYRYEGLGDNSQSRLEPTTIGTRRWTSVSVSRGNSCGIETNTADLYCWGRNYNYELGIGNQNSSPTPVLVSSSPDWTAIATGDYHSCGANANGLYCWGYGGYGALGTGNTNTATVPVLTASPLGGAAAAAIPSAGTHSCAILGGVSRCWGNNYWGEVGDGTDSQRSAPTSVTGGAGTWQQLALGIDHTCGIGANGSLWCWGGNYEAQLGATTDSNYSTVPVQIGSAVDWTYVGNGRAHSCAIRADASMWCWGLNNAGQIGIGSTAPPTSPVLVP
jgi:alpha-tubulin suppressor-like RCC1 family protein